MLERLAHSEATVNELAEPFAMSLPAVSRHRAQYRPCTIDASPLREVAGWAEQYRPIWEGRFEQLETYLREIEKLTAPIDNEKDQP